MLCALALLVAPAIPSGGAAAVVDIATGRVLARYGTQTAAAPGSAIKPFTLMALLRAGLASTRPCERRLRIGARTLDCSHPAATAPMDPATALAYSCNWFFAMNGARLDAGSFARELQEAGLAAHGGAIATAGTREELQLEALGEWGVSVTPLGLASAYARLARRRTDPQAAAVFEGLENCVKFGTGQLAAARNTAVAGKTGTTAGRSWFAGFAPAGAPEIAVAVSLPGGGGGSDAAPVAKAIFEAWASSRREVTVRLFSIDAPAANKTVVLHGPGGYRIDVPGGERLEIPWPVSVTEHGGRLSLTVRMPVEDYVAAVLAGESSVFRSTEALKAMAVAARTFAARNRGRHRAEGYDFCDTTHCQDVRIGAITQRVRDAAEETEGEILWYGGSPALAFYHRNCGGTTEAASEVWPGTSVPYLRSQPDTFCANGEWRAEIGAANLGRALGLSHVEGVRVARRSASGRAAEIAAGGKLFNSDALRLAVGRTLGWNLLRSAPFDVARSAQGFVFHGYGAGHGVGMCQTGADARGLQGQTYRQILEFYFPGTVIGVNARGFHWRRAGGERVDVETTRPGADGGAVALADRALKEAERRAGFSVPFRPRVRVYATIAAFGDATGEPGWVAASTAGRTVRMQPLETLRARGVLERVLLHEMLHVAIESRANPALPPWFREGLAVYLDGSGQEAAAPYRRARACVDGLIRTHGRSAVFQWLERGAPQDIPLNCAATIP